MHGDDVDFDYSKIDNNVALDPEGIDRDEENKYFDEGDDGIDEDETVDDRGSEYDY